MIKMILHNDREVSVNVDEVLYATPVFVEETGMEVLKIVFKTGMEIDVLDKFHEFYEKATEENYYIN